MVFIELCCWPLDQHFSPSKPTIQLFNIKVRPTSQIFIHLQLSSWKNENPEKNSGRGLLEAEAPLAKFDDWLTSNESWELYGTCQRSPWAHGHTRRDNLLSTVSGYLTCLQPDCILWMVTVLHTGCVLEILSLSWLLCKEIQYAIWGCLKIGVPIWVPETYAF